MWTRHFFLCSTFYNSHSNFMMFILFFPHFIQDETNFQRLNKLHKVTQSTKFSHWSWILETDSPPSRIQKPSPSTLSQSREFHSSAQALVAPACYQIRRLVRKDPTMYHFTDLFHAYNFYTAIVPVMVCFHVHLPFSTSRWFSPSSTSCTASPLPSQLIPAWSNSIQSNESFELWHQ